MWPFYGEDGKEKVAEDSKKENYPSFLSFNYTIIIVQIR